jgi:Uma2 family endonuclease
VAYDMIPSPGTEHQEVAGRLAFALESSLRKVRKLWTYEAAGVPEYLIVDPDEQVGILLRLENHRYEEAQRVTWGTLVRLLGGRLEIIVD